MDLLFSQKNITKLGDIAAVTIADTVCMNQRHKEGILQ